MATRGSISIQNEDGSWDGIYVHWDGDEIGNTILKHYGSVLGVRSIVLGGFISSLWETLEKSYAKSNIKEDYESFATIDEARSAFYDMDCEYRYYLNREGILTCEHEGQIEALNNGKPLPMVHT